MRIRDPLQAMQRTWIVCPYCGVGFPNLVGKCTECGGPLGSTVANFLRTVGEPIGDYYIDRLMRGKVLVAHAPDTLRLVQPLIKSLFEAGTQSVTEPGLWQHVPHEITTVQAIREAVDFSICTVVVPSPELEEDRHLQQITYEAISREKILPVLVLPNGQERPHYKNLYAVDFRNGVDQRGLDSLMRGFERYRDLYA